MNYKRMQSTIITIFFSLSADDEVVKLWDLRKLRNFKTISLDDKYTVRGLTFDNSGHYLAVAGPDVRVYQIRLVSIGFPFRP